MRSVIALAVSIACLCTLGWGQGQSFYSGVNATGQLSLVRVVDPMVVAMLSPKGGLKQATATAGQRFASFPEFKNPGPLKRALGGTRALGADFGARVTPFGADAVVTPTYTLAINYLAGGFDGLSHYDQRMAFGGNQYSVEPPNSSIAASESYVLEGVNNAVQIYTSSGVPLLPKVLSSNEFFGLPPAIDRSTGYNGPYPTDMRVFFDQSINRWFVLQRAQDYDPAGFPINSSRIYLAVSQSADPTRAYNIYEMNTTETATPGCPCLLDFPQIGSDQYGFYISGNQYNTFTETFQNAAILAVSKVSLQAGSHSPTAYRFSLPFTIGHEFAIQPATTPPGSSNFLANGGLVYFLSNNAVYSYDNQFSIWAMYNTSSLNTASPNLFLTRTTVFGPYYSYPEAATQRNGPVPYGSSLSPPRGPALIDGGDTRILSLTYSGGRLYAAFCTRVTDNKGSTLVGGGYVVFAPSFRAGVLAAPVVTSGYIAVRGNHLLRPSIVANSRGKGVIAVTLVGPDYFPSAAYVPFDLTSPPSVLRVAAFGAAPQDGFTGYNGYPARWGDYSAAVGHADGSFWVTSQYIPATPRTEAANWGTRVVRYVP